MLLNGPRCPRKKSLKSSRNGLSSNGAPQEHRHSLMWRSRSEWDSCLRHLVQVTVAITLSSGLFGRPAWTTSLTVNPTDSIVFQNSSSKGMGIFLRPTPKMSHARRITQRSRAFLARATYCPGCARWLWRFVRRLGCFAGICGGVCRDGAWRCTTCGKILNYYDNKS